MRSARLCALTIAPALLLAACGGGEADRAEELLQQARRAYVEMTACAAHVELTADYGERVFSYGAELSWEKEGELVITLTSPENVAGASAVVHAGETALEYEGVMVETGPLDDRGLTPVDAVPALLTYAREGFVAECCLEDSGSTGEETPQALRLSLREPEAQPGTGRECELWLDPETFALLRGELSLDGRTVIQCRFSGFTLETGAHAD